MFFTFAISSVAISYIAISSVFLFGSVTAPCPNITSPDNETLSWYEIPTVPDMCFLFDFRPGMEKDIYSDAVAFCETFTADDGVTKAQLVEPRTKALQEAISSYAQLLGGKSVWVGCTDIQSEGIWQWGSGT